MQQSVERWDYFELALRGPETGNPFLDVTFEADFLQADTQVNVRGFYDGDGIYRLRFMPGREGDWQYLTRSNAPELDGQAGKFVCTAPSAGNHGPVRVAGTLHFAYEDGTAYIPVGTTCYVWNLQGDALEEETLRTLDHAPFNKMRMCVFPKRYEFNQNEPPCYPFPIQAGKPWQPGVTEIFGTSEPPRHWDFSRFNPQYFQRLERRILDLRARGIEADLIVFHPYDFGAWGFDHMPAEVNDRYLHYLVARLAAFRNLWWSFANEYDLFFDRKIEDWDHYFQLVQQADPYNHLRSIHNCFAFYDHTQPWVTHCSIQSGVLQRVPAWRKKYNKPVVIDECGYEGDIHMAWGDLSAEELLLRFWLGFVNGGYVGHGETYVNADPGLSEEVLWWSKGGRLKGESVARIAFLRQIFEQAPALTPVEKVDNESFSLLDHESAARAFGQRESMSPHERLIREAGFSTEACGYNEEQGYYLLYYGTHQPGSRIFQLGEGRYRIDVIDTWNMSVEKAAENASGQVRVALPARKYMAVRIRRE